MLDNNPPASQSSVTLTRTGSRQTLSQMLSTVTRASIIDEKDVPAFLRLAATAADPAVLSQELISCGLLTPFQAEAILAGKASELCIAD